MWEWFQNNKWSWRWKERSVQLLSQTSLIVTAVSKQQLFWACLYTFSAANADKDLGEDSSEDVEEVQHITTFEEAVAGQRDSDDASVQWLTQLETGLLFMCQTCWAEQTASVDDLQVTHLGMYACIICTLYFTLTRHCNLLFAHVLYSWGVMQFYSWMWFNTDLPHVLKSTFLHFRCDCRFSSQVWLWALLWFIFCYSDFFFLDLYSSCLDIHI